MGVARRTPLSARHAEIWSTMREAMRPSMLLSLSDWASWLPEVAGESCMAPSSPGDRHSTKDSRTIRRRRAATAAASLATDLAWKRRRWNPIGTNVW